MLIELTNSLLDYKADEEKLLLICLTNLLVSYYEGNHILMATPDICETFASKLTDSRAKEALNYLSNKLYLDYDVLWRIKVVLNNADESNYEMNYTSFAISMSVQPTFFISENLDDIRFYKFLAQRYHISTEIESIDVAGGGDTTGDMFAYLRYLPCFSLAIVDSDIRYPGCKEGRTAEKCKSAIKEKSPKYYLEILPCHEVENLIPLSYLKDISKGTAKSFLQKLIDNNRLDVLRYYDMKNGIIKEKLNSSNEYKSFIQDLYDTLYGRRMKTKPFLSTYDSTNDKGLILPAIHHNALYKFLREKPFYHSDLFETERKKIGDIVYTCLCARGNGPMC